MRKGRGRGSTLGKFESIPISNFADEFLNFIHVKINPRKVILINRELHSLKIKY